MNHIVRVTKQSLRSVITEKNAKVTCDKLPKIRADKTQMLQLFQNLISNGIKFNRSKNPRVHIGFENKHDNWVFFVEDNGIGIKREYLNKVFTIFKRLPTREEYDGTGIGLAVCKKIVERHGGRIWVESEIEKGSTFNIILPKTNN